MIKAYRCELNPPYSLPPTSGETIITAVWVYTGYKILFEIHIPITSLRSSFSPFNYRAEKWHQSITRLKMHEIIEEHPVVQLRFSAHCFGNHPIRFESPLREASQLPQFLKDFHHRYASILNQMVFRDFLIDETFNKLNPTCCASKKPDSDFQAPLPLHEKINFSRVIFQLYNEMANSSNDLVKSLVISVNTQITNLGGFSCLFSLMRSAWEAFNKALQSNNIPHHSRSNFSLFLGGTGVGMSTIVAGLLGAPLKKKVFSRYDHSYRIVHRKNQAIPSTSHGSSLTLGYDIYQQYIDTAGKYSTGGVENRISNSAAISEAIKAYSPKNIIYPIMVEQFTGRDFIPILQSLVKSFPDLDLPLQSASLLFLICRHNTLTDHEIDFKTAIQKIKLFHAKNLCHSIFPGQFGVENEINFYNHLIDWILKKPFPLDEQFLNDLNRLFENELDTEHSRKFKISIIKKQKKLFRLLETLNENNFLFVDPTSPESLKQIDRWECSHRTFSTEKFNMKEFFHRDGGSFTVFINMITAIVLHYHTPPSNHRSMQEILILDLKRRAFFRTIAMIIRRLDLFSEVEPDTQKIYRQFCEQFPG